MRNKKRRLRPVLSGSGQGVDQPNQRSPKPHLAQSQATECWAQRLEGVEVRVPVPESISGGPGSQLRGTFYNPNRKLRGEPCNTFL